MGMDKNSGIYMDDFVSNDGCLYLGIDAGVFTTSICTSDGKSFSERSIAAYSSSVDNPEEKVLFGDKALEAENETIKEFLRGEIKNEDDICRFTDFLRHVLNERDIDADNENIYAIIGVDCDTDIAYKKKLLKLYNEIFTGAMLVDEMFCIAYNKSLQKGSMIVDMGYTKTDICTITEEKSQKIDHLTLSCAGKDIDNEIVKLVNERWPDSQITEEVARKWKEEHGHLFEPLDSCVVDILLENRTVMESIADEIQIACEFVATDIVSGITRVLSDADPSMRESLRNNIHLFGGTSALPGIDNYIENELKEVGGGKIFTDLDPFLGVSEGALEIAKNMPTEFWKQLDTEKQNKELIV